MKIDCIHGYYRFSETKSGELAQLTNRFGFDLERSGDHFTFSDLVDAPRYSLIGKPYLGLIPATSTFEGDPWDVMRENLLVYDFTKGLVLPILAILTVADVQQAGFAYVSNGMLLAGSITEDGTRVTDYAAFYDVQTALFRYSEVEYD